MVTDLKKVIKENKKLKGKLKKSNKINLKSLSKKLPSKKIIRKSQPTLTIKQREVPSVLNDPNRFFNEEMEEVKKTMFFR